MRIGSAALLGAALVAAPAIHAKPQLSYQPYVSSRAVYDTNPRVRVISPEKVFITINEALVRGRYKDETTEVTLTPRVRLSRYTEETELDAEDVFVTLDGNKLFERFRVSGEFVFEEEATISTELEDSGLFNINLDKTTLEMRGSLEYYFNEKTSYSVFGNIVDVSFEEDSRSAFVDYLSYGGGATVRHAISDRTVLTSTLNASLFRTPSTGLETNSYALLFGFEHQIYEPTRVALSIGHNVSHVDFKTTETNLVSFFPLVFDTRIVDDNATTRGEIINLLVSYERERAAGRLEWQRSFSPSSQGSRQEIQEALLYGKYSITRNLDIEAFTSYRERSQEGGLNVARFGDLEIITARFRLRYRINRDWWAETGFRFRQQNRRLANLKSNSERFFIAVRYSPRPNFVPW